jgi:glycosyltransferase involved in cell wall biosynthesis
VPTVSVIIPCFNQGHFLAEAVASVEAQTWSDWEIVVVDDGSDAPETCRVLSSWSHPRGRLVRSVNRGLSFARNLGIQNSTGRYILPLDCDDRIGPRYLAQAVPLLDANESLGIIYSRAEFFGCQSGPWLLPPFRMPEFVFQPAIFCSALFRRVDWEEVGGYSCDLRHGYEDHDFWLHLVKRGRRVVQLDEVHFFYRRTPQSMAQAITLDQQVSAYVAMYRHHRELFLENIETLLRAFLAREGIAQLHHTRPVLQLFLSAANGFSEERSIRTEYAAGSWVELTLALPASIDGETVIARLDPGMQAGIYDVAAFDWIIGGDVVHPGKALGAATVEVAGTALALPAEGPGVRILSYGRDPQIALVGHPAPQGTTAVRLRVRFQPDIESAARSFAAVPALGR